MKTKEFIEKVQELGFEIIYYKTPFSNVESNYDYDSITIYVDKQDLVKIWANCQYAISTISDGHSCYLDGYDVDKLYELCFEYVCTPIKDREEKKYLLLHKFAFSKNLNVVNLAYNRYKGAYRLINCRWDNEFYKVLFTKEEIEKLKEKLNTNFDDFKIVEVEDESY